MSSPSSSSILAGVSATMFQAGPKDVVATPDVYTLNSGQINTSSTINTNVGRFNTFDNSLLNNLRAGAVGTLAALTGLGSLATLLNPAASLGVSSVAARVGGAMGIPVDGSLPSTFTTSLTQSVNLNSTNYTSLLVSTGNVTTAVTTNDVAGTMSILQAVNNMSGNSSMVSVIDSGAQTSAASAMVGSLITLGLSSVLAAFIATQTTPNLITPNGTVTQTVGQQALSQNVQQAIQASDLATVQLCIDNLGPGGVLQQVPNAILLLVQNYKIPSGTASSGYAAQWTLLKGILQQLAPTWDMTQRNGQSFYSLTVFAAASSDCITVMKTDTDPAIVTASWIAKSFPTEDALTTLQTMYPYMLKL